MASLKCVQRGKRKLCSRRRSLNALSQLMMKLKILTFCQLASKDNGTNIVFLPSQKESCIWDHLRFSSVIEKGIILIAFPSKTRKLQAQLSSAVMLLPMNDAHRHCIWYKFYLYTLQKSIKACIYTWRKDPNLIFGSNVHLILYVK